MIYSFRNRRYLIQATIPLARKLANLLGLIQVLETEKNPNEETKNLLREVWEEIELQTSLNGGSSISLHAKMLLENLSKNGLIKLEEVEFLLDELDMQHYHSSLFYKRFESEKAHLTWYKLTPNLTISDKFSEGLVGLKSLINVETLSEQLNNQADIDSLINKLFKTIKNNSPKVYEKTFISFFIDRLSLVKSLLSGANNISHVNVLVDAFTYLLNQKDYSKIDARVWSSLLWHAHVLPTDFSEAIGFTKKEDDLSVLEKKEITKEVSNEILPYIGNARWPSWKALEGDFISLSELLEEKNVPWSKVKEHLGHIISQSSKDDTDWNPGVFLQKMADYIEKHPAEYKNLSALLVRKLALWKDALLKRDPLSILNWINLALLSTPNWNNWFKLQKNVDNKIEQEIIYEIQEDLINNKSLAVKNLRALGITWLLEPFENNQVPENIMELKNGLLIESLFWTYENPKASLFFASLAKDMTEDNSGFIKLSNQMIEIEKNLIQDTVQEAVTEEISEELFAAIVTDAIDMYSLLQASMEKMYEKNECNDDFIRATHSFKTLSLNLNNEYTSKFFGKLEVWGMHMVDLATKLTNKDFEILFSIVTCALITVESWKKNVKVTSLPIDSIVNYLGLEIKSKKKLQANVSFVAKDNLLYNDIFESEKLVETEVNNVDENIFDNFKEEALDIFDELDELICDDTKGQVDDINRLLHTLKGGARISGLMKLGLWVHQLEDVTTKKINELTEDQFKDALQYAFDKNRNLFSEATLEFNSQNENTKNKDIVLKIALEKIEEVSDSLLASEASHKKVELSYSNLKLMLEDAKEPINRLNFLVSEIYVEAEGLLHSGGKSRKKQTSLFDELEMDKFTYFHELTRKLEEAVSDNVLYNNLLEKNIYELSDSSQNSKLWLNIAQKELLKNLHNEAKNYESRLKATVRSACTELGKHSEISFEGSSLLVNKKILDEVTPALEHLVRNSIAHSIEMPKERGLKKESALVSVKAISNVDWFIFGVTDDGAGIDFNKVKNKALEKNMIAKGQEVSNDDLCKIMFMPGFSTAKTVSSIAGRGVGLDAVEEIIKKIGGHIDVNIYDGNKAEFLIYVPMPDWLLSGIKAVVNEKTYVISNSQIEEISLLTSDEVEKALENKHIEIGGNKRSCIYMDYINGTFAFHKVNNFNPVVHLKNGRSIIVDSIEFIEKQPVKSLPNNLYKNYGISGTTILSDSNVGIVIDAMSSKWDNLYEEVAVVNKNVHKKDDNLILIVDDSLTVRKATAKFLQKKGYDVVTAENGLEAVKYLEKEILPAMILMDIEMPVMDGFEALQRIKSVDYLKNIPVVIISSRAVDKHINFAKSIGALDFLGKPFNEDRLYAILDLYTKNKEKV
ncbi:response regulator [archaeon]|nr:response regulator [archaeon]